MKSKPTKFNPAALPTDFMKKLSVENSHSKSNHFLLPGQLFVSREATTISTILGSCVALCLWDARLGVGGMNHYLLPDGDNAAPNRLRYGNVANPELLKQLLALGCKIQDLQAKIFGGSSPFTAAGHGNSLGEKNIGLATEFLFERGIPLIAKEVSGKRGRKLIFQTIDGTTVIKDFENE